MTAKKKSKAPKSEAGGGFPEDISTKDRGLNRHDMFDWCCETLCYDPNISPREIDVKIEIVNNLTSLDFKGVKKSKKEKARKFVSTVEYWEKVVNEPHEELSMTTFKYGILQLSEILKGNPAQDLIDRVNLLLTILQTKKNEKTQS